MGQSSDEQLVSGKVQDAPQGTLLRRRPWSVIALTLSVGFFLAVVGNGRSSGTLGVDFGVFHAGGTLISDEGYQAAYDTGHFSEFFIDSYFPALAQSETVSHFISTPVFGFFSQALAAFPFAPALLVWTVLSFLALVPACQMLQLPRWTPVLFAISPMMAFNTSLGQTGSFVLLLFAALHIAHRQERVVGAGLLGGLMILKPPLAFGYGIMWLLNPRRYRVSIAVAGATGVVLSIPTVAGGLAPWEGFVGAMLERTAAESGWSQQSASVSEFVKLLSPGAPSGVTVASWILGFLVAAGIVQAAKRRFPGDGEILSAAAAIATVVASPHLLVYDSLVLAIPIAVAYRRGVLTHDRAGLLASLIVGSIALGPVLFEAQFQLIGRGIGAEFPALMAATGLLARWVKQAELNELNAPTSEIPQYEDVIGAR